MKYYKIIAGNNKSCNGGDFNWTEYLPTKNEDGTWNPGKWTPRIKNVVPCKSGYHVTDADHLLTWADAQLYECEGKSDPIFDDDKYVFSSIRLTCKIETWNDKTLRLFACWCVRQVWHLLDDERSKNTVIVAEKYANGEATKEELHAASNAAWDVAWDAARDAARAAAMTSTWDAALDAASNAAWYVAWYAALDAETKKATRTPA